MNLTFDKITVNFIGKDDMDDLSVSKKLGFMANYGSANVGNGIFGHLARRDFPDLFEKALAGESYNGMSLEDLVIHVTHIQFCFKMDKECVYKVDVPLNDTSGELQVSKSSVRFAIVEWRDGKVRRYDKIFGDEFIQMEFTD